MALVKFGAILTDAVGKVGGVTFQRGPGSSRVRADSHKKTKVTTSSNLILNQFNYLSNYWSSGLSTSQRAGWLNFALEHPIKNSFGDVRALSAQGAFIKQNRLVLWTGQPLIADAPILIPFPNEIIFDSYNMKITPFRVNFQLKPAPFPPGFRVFGYSTGSRPPGISKDYRHGLYLVEKKTGAGRRGINYPAEYESKYGFPIAGQRLYFKAFCLNDTTGQIQLIRQAWATFVPS